MSTTDTLNVAPTALQPAPWWRFGIVWFTFGLPATVVVASLFTAGIAWRHVDPVVVDPPASGSAGLSTTVPTTVPTTAPADGTARANALEPAQRARNHAATPRP